jgi:LysR family transcriptional regulator, cyn operon transcriptional activator
MELRQLRYFVAIADAGTMARAAGAVFVTQSTLSHQLAQLEKDVGDMLFERVGRSLRLSDAGRQLLGYARSILALVEESKQAVQQVRALATGSLRVGVIHSMVTSLVPLVAAGFVRQHPGVKLQMIELSAIEIEAQVVAGSLDLGVAFFPPTSDAVLGEHLFDDTLALALPAKHPLAAARRVRFAQLADVPLAMLSQKYQTRRLVDSYFQQAGVSPKVVVEMDSVDALHRIVEQGVAAAFLPARTTRPLARVRLVQVTDPRPIRAAGLIWRRNGYRSAAARVFVEELNKVLGRKFD